MGMDMRKSKPGWDDRAGPYFRQWEFRCPCCGDGNITQSAEVAINELRRRLGKPFTPTSAYRCEKHNAAVGGEPNSQHIFGHAVDIPCASQEELLRVYELALEIPLFKHGGIGFYPVKRFIHVDTREGGPARWVK